MAIIRRPVRSRPIRLFLISMFAVPLLSLTGLWVFAATVTIPPAISDHEYSVAGAAVSGPAVSALTIALPVERQQTYVWLLSGRKAPKASLLAARLAVSKALPGAESALLVDNNLLTPATKATLDTLLADLRGIGALRQSVDSGNLSPAAAFQAYDNIVDAQFQAYYAGILNLGASLQAPSTGAVDASYSVEMVSREIALVDGALAVSHAAMTPAERQLFIATVADRRQLITTGVALLPGDLSSRYVAIAHSATYGQFQTMEGKIAASTGNEPIPVNAKTWESVSGAYLGVLITTQAAEARQFGALSQSRSNGLVTEAAVAGGLGLLAVLASVLLLAWFGRKVTGDLTRLHTSVRGMAEERLPRVVDRLRRGEDVDVLAESPPPAASTIGEISQIARSFGIVQEAAVAAAVEQARLRKGVNQVFLNISMRSQSLLHRQLALLDSMERRTSGPEELADLFRLDHLTTRMRRHAESLIILSGSTPGRGWREPVPVVDVLRAAVAEVEEYVRVDVMSESRDLVAGNAVNDVIHLVAELVENATAFSPPNTRIEVRADRVGAGLVAEVEDRGLGIGDDELADINRQLASPPEFDLASSEQLGLFVVSRLAARRKIKVALRQSVYGGTTAVILLPFGVMVREEEASQGRRPAGDSPVPPSAGRDPQLATGGPLPRANGSGGGPASGMTGRHRMLSGLTGRRADALAPPDGGQDTGSKYLPVPPWDLKAAATRERSRPAGPAGPRRDREPAGPMSSGSHLGMPVRVPQTSLAPQLRVRHDTGPQAAEPDVPAISGRSPEVTRTMMNLMQQGWQHGRVDDLDDPAGAPAEPDDSEDGNGTD
jgi:signal transduction histidine kinase